jgi:hypothetical protein
MSAECSRPANVDTNGDDTWYATCGCGTTVCQSGTYEEAVNALTEHRAEA